MPDPKPLEDLLSTITTAICRKGKPSIRYSSDDEAIILQVPAEDHGRVVGKKGLVIWSLNTVLLYASYTSGFTRRVPVILTEPAGPRQKSDFPFKANLNWDKKIIGGVIEAVTTKCLRDKAAWVIQEDKDYVKVLIRADKYLRTGCSDPDWALAAETVIRAAGMSQGVVLNVEVLWE